MNGTRLCCLIAALVSAGAASACSKVSVATNQAGAAMNAWTVPGLLRVAETDEPNSLVRMFSHQSSADDMTCLLFEPLFRFDDRGEPVPALATQFPTDRNGLISKDGLRITFKLRPGVRWADGAAVTADDVVFTWRAIMNPDNAVVSTWGFDDIADMVKDNAHQVTMVLKRPLAPAVYLFSEGSFPPLPAHLLARYASLNKVQFGEHPLGDGPFVVRRWIHGQDLLLGSNPLYWRGSPRVSEIDVKFIPDANTAVDELKTGDLDLIDGVSKPLIAQLAHLPGVRLTPNLLANDRHMDFNCRGGILSDPVVRRAIAHAVDVDRIIRDVYGGYGVRAVTDVPPFSWAASGLPPISYDPELARGILDADGWKLGPDGIRQKNGARLALSITSSTGNRPNERAEDLVAQELKAAGVELTIKNYAPSVLFAQNGPLFSGNYDIEWTVETQGVDPDDLGDWGCDYMPPHGANTAFYCDREVDRLLRDAETHYDRERRRADYADAWRLMLRDVPGLMIYWDREVIAANADLKNFKPAPVVSDYWNAWEWQI